MARTKNLNRGGITLVGVDTGGTFTDLVLFAGGRVVTHKVPSTPHDFERGVLRGIREILAIAGAAGPFALVHGTTVATNALLERKGARTGLITTRGFRDALEIGRQNRPELYNFQTDRPPPLVPRERRIEAAERVSAEGDILEALDEASLERALDELKRLGVEAVAVCFLFSFLRPEHEQAAARAARKRGWHVSASCEVLPEFREFERMSTTVINAFVSPVMGGYLGRLEAGAAGLGAERLRVMQSNGGALSARGAGEGAVNTLLSGPAGGVIGAMAVARQALDDEHPRLVTFDMGGTSTDVSLIDGGWRVTTEGEIGGLPVRVPMIDIHTVGAGGGSIAWVDAGGALHTGPESAGADPGPACYGRGDRPTVTDANLLLGRIAPEHFLGGRMELDAGRAARAIEHLARLLGMSNHEAARAILRIVNSDMERAIRVISVARGHDPRDFTLVSFGGAGGLHACDLAAALRMPRVLIPRNPGVLSAWGTVSADIVKNYSRTVLRPLDAKAKAPLLKVYKSLEKQALGDFEREGFKGREVVLERRIDARYRGQSFELSVVFLDSLAKLLDAFHEAHQRRYGHCAPGEAVEAVTLRVRASAPLPKPALEPIGKAPRADAKDALLDACGMKTYDRARLLAGHRLAGPALIVEDFATTLLPDGWRGTVDRWGNLLFERV